MSTTTHAIKVGARRGWTEFKLSLRSPEDLLFYLLWGGGLLVYLFLNRHLSLEGTELTLAALVLPGALAAMIMFGAVVGPAFQLVVEREDGTLLRAKAAPHGLQGYVTGQVVLNFLGALPILLILLLPSAFFVEGLGSRGFSSWVAALAIIMVGTLALLPIGFIIGSLARKPGHVTTWGLLPVLVISAISGVFTPITTLWGWVQGVAQVFPMYWLGHALRWAFLPEEASMLEAGGQWNLLVAFAVVGAWGVVGLLLTPRILARMARRESGSAVEARRAERMQRIG